MRKYFGVAAVIVFLMALALALWGGVRDIFESPVASVPSILIDHKESETEIYVHGMNDFRYTNISLRVTIGNETFERSREDTYFMYFNSSENFTVNITVLNKNKKYSFNASVVVAAPEEVPKILTIYEEKNDKIYTYTLNNDNLPWKRLLERTR
jgi:hypothetical protein